VCESSFTEASVDFETDVWIGLIKHTSQSGAGKEKLNLQKSQ
jgi:hypothetical protein